MIPNNFSQKCCAQMMKKEKIQRTLNLTEAESRLAICLLDGMSLKEAAASIGITYETARSLVKTIFRKTETQRQSQLVLLLARVTS
jgi:DNA-binding CsgD family transcriptional regulator